MTGTPKCSDSVVVMSGMRAPPPVDATAARSDVRRCGPASPAPRPRIGERCRMASSSSLRVRRTRRDARAGRLPGRWPRWSTAVPWPPRHWARSLFNGPIADVPDTSTAPASDSPSRTCVSSACVDQVAGQLGVADRLADRSAVGGVDERDARSAAAEVAQRDHTAGRQAGVVVQRGDGRPGVGDQRRARELAHRGQRFAQSLNRGRPPMRRVRHRDRVGGAAAVGHVVEHLAQRLGEQRLAAVACCRRMPRCRPGRRRDRRSR